MYGFTEKSGECIGWFWGKQLLPTEASFNGGEGERVIQGRDREEGVAESG